MSKIKLTGTELSSSLNSTGSFGRADIGSALNIDVNSGQGQIGMSSDAQRLFVWGGSNRAVGNGAYIQLDGTNLGGNLNLFAGGATGSVQVLGNLSGSLGQTGSFSALKVVAEEDGTTITTDRFGLKIDGQAGFYPLTVQSPYETAARFISTDGTANIEIGDNSTTQNYSRIQVVGDSRMQLIQNNVEALRITQTGITINDNSEDRNFRVETNNQTNTFVVDGGSDKVSIGIGTGGNFNEKFKVAGNVGITGSLHVSGNISTSGSIIAKEFRTEFVNQIIATSSGSTEFGDDTGDVHRFTGSLNISASANTPAIQIGTGNVVRTGIKISDNRAQFGYDGGYAVVQGGGSKGVKLEVNNDTFAGGTEAMIVNASANVGIGSTEGNIAARLEVQQSAGTPIVQLRPSNASSALNPLIQYRSQLEGSANYFMTKGTSTYFATFDGAVPSDESKMIKISPNGTLSPTFAVGDDGSAVATLKVGGDATGVFIIGGATGSSAGGSMVSSSRLGSGSFGHIIVDGSTVSARNLEVTGSAGFTHGLRLGRSKSNDRGVIILEKNNNGDDTGIAWLNTGGSFSATLYASKSVGDFVFANSHVAGGLTSQQPNFVISASGDVRMNSGAKLFFDNADAEGHTYIQESTNDVLDFYAGGQLLLRVEESGEDITFAPDNKFLGLGTGKDFKMHHNSANTILNNTTGDLHISQSAQDKDIIFSVNDGGSVVTMLTLDGSGQIFNFNNRGISGANNIQFNDPGSGEGVSWSGGSWAIFISPDDMSNANGNLQFISGSAGAGRTNGHIAMRGHSEASLETGYGIKTQLYMPSSSLEIGNASAAGANVANDARVNIVSHGNERTLKLTAFNDGTNGFRSVSMLMQGYEGRAAGTFFEDINFSGHEFFCGVPYQGNTQIFQIGYDDGGLAETQQSASIMIHGPNKEVAVGNATTRYTFEVFGNAQITDTSDNKLIQLDSDNSRILLQDDVSLKLGTGGDFFAFHNGTATLLRNNTGDLFIDQLADDQDIFFRSDDGSGGVENYLMLDGSDGSVRLPADSKKLKFGSSTGMLSIYHNGTDARIDNAVGNLRFFNYANDTDIVFHNDDGSGGTTEYITLDGSLTKNVLNVNTRVPDSVIIGYGASDDLQIYHNGTNSFGADNYTGTLIFQQRANDDDIIFKCDDGSGGVTAYLTLDGSATSIKVAKNLELADNVELRAGAGDDLRLVHNGSNSFIDSYTGALFLRAQADDQDIALQADDGSGGMTTYLNIDGSEEQIFAYRRFNVFNAGGNNQISLFTENDTSAIGDTFAGNTSKSYIQFSAGASSNDPGFILHETRGSEANEGVLHLCPSDDNADSDYISIHGTNDADSLKLATSGKISGVSSIVMDNGSESAPSITFDSDSNTGIFRSGADDMAFTAGGAERFAANGNGLDLQGNSANKIVHTSTGTRDKYRVWNSSLYAIGMDNAMTYGGLNDFAMTFQMNNEDDRGFVFLDSSHSDAQGAMSLTTNGKMVVATSISVGAGESTTSAAATTLDVNGTSNFTDNIFIDHGGSDYSPNIQFLGGSNTPGSNSHENALIGYYDNSGTGTMLFEGKRSAMNWAFNDSDETLFLMASDGDFHAEGDVVAASTTTNSDRRLKKNINDIPYGLSEVLQLRGVEFDWKKKRSGVHDIGVIAQEVEEIIPEIVNKKESKNDGMDILSVDYGKLTAVLVEAVKEQQVQIEELKEDIKKLRGNK